MNGTQRRALVSPLYCMYSGIAKGTSQAESMLNSKKSSPYKAIVELRLIEGIRQSVAENSVKYRNSVATF